MSISILSSPASRPTETPMDGLLTVAPAAMTAIGTQVKERLWQRMTRECEAMVRYALGTGRTVPIQVMERLAQATSEGPTVTAGLRRVSVEDGPNEDAGAGVLSAEISAFALLSEAHAALSRTVSPATPEAVLLMADERTRHPLWCQFGPLPLVRQMLGLAILSLAMLLAVSLSPEVNTVNMSKSLLTLAGYPLFLIELFLISAASLGGCFANLQKINAVISDGTYDPRVQSTYWTRWVMGMISGVVLSQLIYDIFLLHQPSADPAIESVPPSIGEPILSLLGGYSVDIVHGILKHIINTLGNLFRVSGDGAIESQERARIAEALAQERRSTASELVELQRALTGNPDVKAIRNHLDSLIQRTTQ
jgi:hypothetical protein